MFKYYNEPINLPTLIALDCYFKKVIYGYKCDIEDIKKDIYSFKDKIDFTYLNDFFNTPKFKKYYDIYYESLSKVSFYRKYTNEKILEKLHDSLLSNRIDYSNIIFLINEYNKRNVLCLENDCFLIKNLFYLYDNDVDYFDFYLNEMNDEQLNIELSNVLENNLSKSLINSLDIYTFNDLKKIDMKYVQIILSLDFEKLLTFLKTIVMIHSDELVAFNEAIEEKIPCRSLLLLSERYSLYGYNKTLDELGIKYNLTRERIRQILKKGLDRLYKFKDEFYRIIGTIFDQYSNDYGVLDLSVFESIVNKKYAYLYIAFIMENDKNINLYVDKSYKVIYYKDLTESTNLVLKNLSSIIYKEDLDSYSLFERQVILHNFRNRNNCFINKSIHRGKLYCDILDELYPKGIKVYNEDVVINVNKRFSELYFEDSLVDGRYLGRVINDYDYCLIDNGTYINRRSAPELEKELIEKIFIFIIDNESVYYSTIYEVYKNEFNQYGINNWYFVKGIIDNYFKDDFDCNKFYIKLKECNAKPVKKITEYISNLNSVFSMSELKNKFPGVNEFILWNILESSNDIVEINKNQFVFKGKIKIEEEDKKIFKDSILKLFNSFNFTIISSKKAYSRTKILNPELFKKYDFIKDEYSYFSIMKMLFQEELFFKRPMISNSTLLGNTSEYVVISYINDYDTIDVVSIKRFINKMNLRMVNIQSVFEKISDEYLQINEETIIKKEIVSLDDFIINDIDNSLKLYIDSFDYIDTSNYNGYVNLPKIEYPWNSYLLIGIIRSYLNDKYIIDIKKKSSDKVLNDFIVRRKAKR